MERWSTPVRALTMVLVLALSLLNGSLAAGEEALTLDFTPEAREKLGKLGPDLFLDWGAYRNT